MANSDFNPGAQRMESRQREGGKSEKRANQKSPQQGREKKANKLEQSGLSTEQLLAMQEEAFRDAAQRHG
jgi:hypothetical protein